MVIIISKKMDLDKVSNSVVDIDKGVYHENLLEYYKAITFKLIFTCESTMFKITEFEKLKSNLVNYQTNTIISEYIKHLFNGIIHNDFDEEIDKQLTEIMKLTNNNRDKIIKKCFYIIDNFYKYLERANIRVSDYEKFKISFIEVFNDFIKYNTQEIFDIMNDSEFDIETNFELSLID